MQVAAPTDIEAEGLVRERMPPGKPSRGERLRDHALAELAQAAAQLARQGGARHAGIHQARKSMRRVRATLALARRPLGARGRRLDQDLASLCRGLGALRDAQALTEALARIDDKTIRDVLPAAMTLAAERRDARLAAELVRDPGLGRRRARLEALAARLARLDWDAVRRRDLRASLARSERRLAKARRRAARRPGDDECWHVFRRRVRRLRQQQELLAGLVPGLRTQGGVTTAEATALGHAQDDVLLLRHCGRGSPFPPAIRQRLRKLAQDRLAQVRR